MAMSCFCHGESALNSAYCRIIIAYLHWAVGDLQAQVRDPVWQASEVDDGVGARSNNELLATTTEDLLHNSVGNHGWLDDLGLRRCEVVHERRGHWGCGECWVNDCELDLWCVVEDASLVLDALVEAQRCDLGVGVWHETWRADERCNGCNGDNVALLLLGHVWQELLDGVVVADDIELEDLLQRALSLIEDGAISRDSSVIDEDAGVAVLLADLLRGVCDGLSVGDVALEVVDLWVALQICWKVVADVNAHDVDALLGKLLAHEATEATSASCDDGDLVGPVIAVLL